MDFTCGCSRKLLAAHEPRTLRDFFDSDDFQQINRLGQGVTGTGAVIIDDRRRRPRYFDGRFLAARDLTREQSYFLSRQADLGRAGGAGVVHGLAVIPGRTTTSVRISAGHGITPAGELVLLVSDTEVDLASIADIQRLDAAFGLRQIPNPPAGNRSGLFVLALRPVEFTANPIASYPTSLNGPRSVEDGDIVEAVAITLIPYPSTAARNEINRRRGHLAREIFVDGGNGGISTEALPLAVIALDRGFIEWIDPYLVRREVGAEHGDVLGLGFAPRATREAYLLQYDHNLQDVLRLRRASQKGWKFSATEHFEALPPAGRMPSDSINPDDLTQVFFPPEVNVELSFVPSDEVRCLLEESLLLPPIDLSLQGDDLESTSVVVLLPIPRHQVREFKSRLSTLTRPLLPAAPNLIARRRPLEMLRTLRLPVPMPTLPVPAGLGEEAWKQALTATDLLWFMRRRNLSYRSEITGVPVDVVGDELSAERRLEDNMRGLGTLGRFRDLRNRASSGAVGPLFALFGSPKMLASGTLTLAALQQLEDTPNLDSASVLGVSTRFSAPDFGIGITRAETILPSITDRETVRALLASNTLSTLDRLGTTVQDPERLRSITNEVVSVASSTDPDREARLRVVDSAVNVLASRPALSSNAATEIALSSIEAVNSLDTDQATNVATTLESPTLGSGLTRLAQVDQNIQDTQVVRDLAATGALATLDRVGTSVTDEAQLRSITSEVVTLTRSTDPDRLTKIDTILRTRLRGGSL